MRTCSLTSRRCLRNAAAALLLVCHSPHAQAERHGGDLQAEAGQLFATAFTAYVAGNKEEAVEDYSAAAELGHIGAQWKLARMYLNGDGVPVDERRAYETLRDLVQQRGGMSPRARDAVFVASAFETLGQLLASGIEGYIEPNPVAARSVLFHAASYYGDASSQYRLGRMMLEGEGGSADPRQASRWLNLSAKKGNVPALALLGSILLRGESGQRQQVLGLSMLTRARALARGDDREWIETLQAEAFIRSSPEVRRAATELAETQLNGTGG